MLHVICFMCLVAAGLSVRVDDQDDEALFRKVNTCACNEQLTCEFRGFAIIATTLFLDSWTSVHEGFCNADLHTHHQALKLQLRSTLNVLLNSREDNNALKPATDALANAMFVFKADINQYLTEPGAADPVGVKASWEKSIAKAKVAVQQGAEWMLANEEAAKALLEKQEATDALQEAMQGVHIPNLERAMAHAREKLVEDDDLAKGKKRLDALNQAATTFREEEAKGREAVNAVDAQLVILKGIMEKIAGMRDELGERVPGDQADETIKQLIVATKKKTEEMKTVLRDIESGAAFIESNATTV